MTRQDLDYSRERTLQSRVWSLEAENADLRRWKAMEKPLTAAMSVVASDVEKLRAENELLRPALGSCASWIERWTQHVGTCKGGDRCTCGRTAVLYEAGAALGHEQSASGEVK